MNHPVRLALAGALLAATAAAQEPAPAPAPAAPAPTAEKNILQKDPAADATATPAPAPAATPKRPRAISSEVAAIMATGLPKYNPPKPVEVKPAPDADAADPDKPKNGVVRLPSVTVKGNRVPIFRERDLYDEKGQAKLYMERHPGLNIPLIGFMNRPIAAQMYRDEQRLSDIDELRKAASDAQTAGDSAGSDYIRKTAAESFMRRADFGSLSDRP
ncbi:MAG TPA: hypothetical protein VG838_11025 [Opitutaceae bacterium]|nr:hypothetical protein [Opitutaceae bacterium]